MSDKANIDPLVGRHFVSKSGKVCRIERLAEGAIRVVWKGRPEDHSREDELEFMQWVESILGRIQPTMHRGRQGEQEWLRRWQQDAKKP